MNDVTVPKLPLAPQLVPVALPQALAAPAPADARVAFAGDRPAFRRLVLRGALLEFVTAGFYRFWLATDMRRQLWSRTAVDGDAPEYVGTAKQLLVGFLVAMAILVPIYVGYFLLGLEAERLQAFASIPLALFYYVFLQFAIYRSRRYRLTRTVWRGVRFSMTGSGLSYAWRVGLWTVLVFVSLGLALPWRQAALEQFKMRYTSYGNLEGRFEGTGGGLFQQGWWLWLVGWGLVALPAVAVVRHFSGGDAEQVAGVIGLACFVQVVVAPFIYARYKSIEWRWWGSGIRFGEVRFSSDMRPGVFVGLYWKVIGWSILLLLALAIWMGATLGIGFSLIGGDGSVEQKMLTLSQHWGVMTAAAVGYVAFILGFWAVMRIYLIHDVWQRVAQSVTVHNLAAAGEVAARQGELAGAVGEGLAGSLDVVGF
ncbi:MAG: DUF898 domain-containing protein [Xanthobacteraceae bacterium]|nr:DUF898 domain-containing protein [Xanthobacteraceae bacterium]